MDTVRSWTGAETTALRRALRMSVRDFAAHLGVAIRTVSKWEARRQSIVLQPASQAILDVVLTRTSADEAARFRRMAGTEETTPLVDRLQASDVLLPLVVQGRTVLAPISVDMASGHALVDLRTVSAGVHTEAPTSTGGDWPSGNDVVGGGEMEIARRRALGALAYGLAATAWGDASRRRTDARHRRHLRPEVMERVRSAIIS